MFSLILPVHNEARNLSRNIGHIIDSVSRVAPDYEIILAEDGSTDGTHEMARELSEGNPRIRLMHSDEKLGRGLALKRALADSRGELTGYMDIDLATNLSHLEDMLRSLREHDVVTGSRLLDRGTANRYMKRYLLSTAFNLMVRLMFGSRVKDHQCGFKGFRKHAIVDINREVRDNHWFWDTEALVIAQRRGYRVHEFPVRWQENTRSKVNIKRDVVHMGQGMVRLFLDLRR